MAGIEDAIVKQIETYVPELARRVFPALEVPDKIGGNYCIYQRISTQRLRTLTEQGSYISNFQFTIYAKTYDEIITLKEAVKAAFEDKTGQYVAGAPFVQMTDIENEYESYEPQTDQPYAILEISFFYNN